MGTRVRAWLSLSASDKVGRRNGAQAGGRRQQAPDFSPPQATASRPGTAGCLAPPQRRQ